MAAHKWWRLWMPQSEVGSNGFIWLAEVKFCDAQRVDMSVGGTAIASSEASASYVAAKAFDKVLTGTTGTGWSSAKDAFPAWIGYGHSEPVDIKAVEVWLQPASGSSLYQYPVWATCKLQYSDDGVAWNDEAGQFLYYGKLGPGGSGVFTRKDSVSAWVRGATSSLYENRLPQTPLNGIAMEEFFRWEVQTTGAGRIAGKVTIENIPGSRKVRLYRKHDGLLMRETWSAANGDYSFELLDPNWEYFVVAHDHLRIHNAVVSDMIDPP